MIINIVYVNKYNIQDIKQIFILFNFFKWAFSPWQIIIYNNYINTIFGFTCTCFSAGSRGVVQHIKNIYKAHFKIKLQKKMDI